MPSKLLRIIAQKLRSSTAPVAREDEITSDKARALVHSGHLAEAEAQIHRMLRDQPTNVDVLLLSAEIALARGELAAAIEAYSKVVELRPEHPLAYYKRGNVLKDMSQHLDALTNYDHAIALEPGYGNAFCNRGVVLEQLGRNDDARNSYDRAIQLNPGDAIAYHNRGGILRKLAQTNAALQDYDRAIQLQPSNLQAECNRGLLFAELKRSDEALASYSRCIEIDPHFYQAHFNLGVLLRELGRLAESLASYERAAQVRPHDPQTYCNQGVVLGELGRWEEGIKSFDRAIELDQDFSAALANRAGAQVHQGRHALALSDYDRALAINPHSKFALGARLHSKMQLCDWTDLDAEMQHVSSQIEAGAKASHPFHTLALFDSPRLHEKAAATWVAEMYPDNPLLGPIPRRPRKDRIHIGYFSPDFRDHPTAHLTADLFRCHDRARFEISGFSAGPNTQDDYRKRLEASFDHFHDVTKRSDLEVAAQARAMGVDIAVDLGGHTALSRTGVFALRLAPIQINFLGYPGTMAADYFDYVIADQVLISPHSLNFFSEKIIYLPNSYQPNSAREIGNGSCDRMNFGLPETGFVFCCFNNNFKLSPRIFDRWMRILVQVDGSVLWLLRTSETVVSNLRSRASVQGVDPQRLVFAPRMATADHLARHRAADLFLDTLPYNAHTTASDALLAGLPLITCSGESFASRVAASLLRASGLSELVAGSLDDYERMAVELANDPARLARLREKVFSNQQTEPLFDIRLFSRHIETAYTLLFEHYLKGNAPSSMRVEALSL